MKETTEDNSELEHEHPLVFKLSIRGNVYAMLNIKSDIQSKILKRQENIANTMLSLTTTSLSI